MILCQFSLEEFLDLLPEERVSTFGAIILADHIVGHHSFTEKMLIILTRQRMCNEDLYSRLVAMETGQDSEIDVT